jgi:hypothetical protein
VEFLIVLALVAVVVLVVSAPLRRSRQSAASQSLHPRDNGAVAELEAAREAKFREIRDAELDHRTGKLSDADYESIDGTLRAEAVEILRELDRARGG